ncbi:hypothetical protein [Flavobacterium sp.]|uniref:hypothetical protein n=1 Tax=Flavobacterium sp. TaxID=239 RepID=UPI002614C9EC|nr:hypothetical protein [Flavobacterium sp.]
MQAKVRSRKFGVARSIFFLLSIFFSLATNAQCAMCRAALESEGNTIKAEAVNDGIVYLMAIPYLLVAFVGYAVYRVFKKKPSS